MFQWIGEGLAQALLNVAANAGGSAVRSVEWRWLMVGSVLCALVCGIVAHVLGFPAEPGFNGSVLCGPSPVFAMIAVAVAFAASMIVGLIAMLVTVDEAGLVCTCAGLGALAVRCGSIRSVLQGASGSGVFVTLAVESAVLLALVVIGWIGLRCVFATMQGKPLAKLAMVAPNELVDAPLGTKLSTLGIQVLVMGVCELVLVQTDSKAQALVSVGIAGFVGSFAAYWLFAPLPQAIWYWAGPCVLAILGYLLAMFSPDGLGVGEVHGWAAALARPTPLDYGSIGTAAALLGYWSARRQAQAEEHTADNEPPPQVQSTPAQ